jgi:hypothetical protein
MKYITLHALQLPFSHPVGTINRNIVPDDLGIEGASAIQ